MQQTDERIAAGVRTIMSRLTDAEGSVRTLSMRSGLSEKTIRSVAATGIIASHRTAAALEAATAGEISSARSVQPNAKGADLYSREPAVTIMKLALQHGRSVGDVLRAIGITHHDLWVYMNHGDGLSDAVKTRVSAALRAAGMDTGKGEEA